MLTDEFVLELVLAEPGDLECVLPATADGELEVWAGNDGYEAYGYTADGCTSLDHIAAIIDEIERHVPTA